MTAGPEADARQHPTFTNAHAQMCAVITALTVAWGDEAQSLIRKTYRELGHQTGQQMIRTGMVPAGADLETYGRVSEQIMDTCGLEGWTRIPSDREHRTVVPGCASYVPLFDFLGAPDNVCSLPFEWDNGCLDVINDELEIWPRQCVYRGAADCHYVISPRQQSPDGDVAAPSRQAPGAAVTDEPTWTNPTAGFLALIGAAAGAFGDEASSVLVPALHSLGVRAGHEVLDSSTTVEAAAELMGERYSAAGFTATTARRSSAVVEVELGRNPYGPVLEHFGARDSASELFAAYDNGWIEAADHLEVRVMVDSWRRSGEHILQIRRAS
jgi:hypothetical protein